MSREAFEAWWPSLGQTIGKVAAYAAWQACAAEKELAALQARVRELESTLQNIVSEFEYMRNESDNAALFEVIAKYKAIYTSSPDQSLQRALLDARIDEHIVMREQHYMSVCRVDELRAKRAELGE